MTGLRSGPLRTGPMAPKDFVLHLDVPWQSETGILCIGGVNMPSNVV